MSPSRGWAPIWPNIRKSDCDKSCFGQVHNLADTGLPKMATISQPAPGAETITVTMALQIPTQAFDLPASVAGAGPIRVRAEPENGRPRRIWAAVRRGKRCMDPHGTEHDRCE